MGPSDAHDSAQVVYLTFLLVLQKHTRIVSCKHLRWPLTADTQVRFTRQCAVYCLVHISVSIYYITHVFRRLFSFISFHCLLYYFRFSPSNDSLPVRKYDFAVAPHKIASTLFARLTKKPKGMQGCTDSMAMGGHMGGYGSMRSPVHSQAMLLPGHPHAMMMAHPGMGHPGLPPQSSPYDASSGHGLMDIHAS